MTTTKFFDQLEHDLRDAYIRRSTRRRRLRMAALMVTLAVVFVGTAGATTDGFGWFTIDQRGHVNIVGTPPALIACSTSGCGLPTAPPAGGRLLYYFDHRLGDDLPTSGNIAESLPGQSVSDANGNPLVPPAGAQLAYVCTSIDGSRLDCSPLSTAGATLPRGAAVYILSPSEYVPASSH